MQYSTYAEIKAKVQRELDIEVEEFIQPDEFLGYVNDGIKEAESDIHKLGLEDEYFLTKTVMSLVSGQEDYSLPTNIFADKIRKIVYSNGTTIYTIDRLRGRSKFENIARINQYTSVTDYYKFIIRNDSPTVKKIQLIPPSRETSSNTVTIWFIREAEKMVDDSSVCDLPELAMQFLYQYIKCRVYEKEGHVNQDSANLELDKVRARMIAVLEQQVADDETEIEKDLSIYQDLS